MMSVLVMTRLIKILASIYRVVASGKRNSKTSNYRTRFKERKSHN